MSKKIEVRLTFFCVNENLKNKKQTYNITLIIPCYNEEKRLLFSEFDLFIRKGVRLIFVDDGSTDKTLKKIRAYSSAKNRIYVVSLAQNAGKAAAVRAGILYALKKFPKTDWYGFWDADFSAPPSQLSFLLKCAAQGDNKAVAIWGSRFRSFGSDIKRSFLRHFLGRLFAAVIKTFLNVCFYDTQCGAKLFKKSIIKKAFREPFITDWIFDVEIYLRIIPNKIQECPLQKWHSKRSSKINFFRLLFSLPKQIFFLKKKYLTK